MYQYSKLYRMLKHFKHKTDAKNDANEKKGLNALPESWAEDQFDG